MPKGVPPLCKCKSVQFERVQALHDVVVVLVVVARSDTRLT